MTSPVHPPLRDSSNVILTFGANLSGADTTAYTETVKSNEEQNIPDLVKAIREGSPDACLLRRGFTLLEILIVIAITAVLALLLMSLLASLREKSQDVQCQANLRTLASAGILYASERNGLLPERVFWKDPIRGSGCLYPYFGLPLRNSGAPVVKKASVLTCPAIQASEFKTASEWYCTYSINQYSTGAGSGEELHTWEAGVRDQGAPLRLSNVSTPSTQAFFLDGTATWEKGAYRYSAYQEPPRLQAANGDRLTTWRTPYIHQNKIHVVFLDGHVEAITRERAEREFIAKGAATTRKNPFWGAKN